MNKYPLRLKPVYKDAIWGGDTLLKRYGKNNGTDRLAESWELAIHGEGMSVIDNGEYAGMPLSEYLGIRRGTDGGFDFPLMVKFIDARDKLSVQVHPNKTELWYIVEAEQGAQLVYGLKEDFNEESFRSALSKGTLENLLRYVDIHTGEFYLLPSGLIHAIGGGILIAEIQQNSNVTYRVYDYNRGREIHTEAAIDTIKELNENGTYTGVAECDFFRTEKIALSGVKQINTEDTFVHVLCLDGSGFIGGEPIQKGESYFIPRGSGNIKLNSRDGMSLLITSPK